METLYLDNATTTFPKPREVLGAMETFYANRGVSPSRGGYDLGHDVEAMIVSTRSKVARTLGTSETSGVCFTHNGTDSLNLALSGLLREGDHVVTTYLEHNSVLRPLRHLQEERSLEIDWVPFDSLGKVDPHEIGRRLRAETRLVVINHGSNVLGTVQDLTTVGRLCRENDVFLVVDASQTAGAVALDVERDHIEVLATTGHKSLMGPTGVGVLWVRQGTPLEATRWGGTGVRSEEKHHPEELPLRLEAGTPNVLGIAGLAAGIDWLQGREGGARPELELRRQLALGLGDIGGVEIYNPADWDMVLPMVTFNIEGIASEEVAQRLDATAGIACRGGWHCAPMAHQRLGTDAVGGAVRMSLGPFNDANHVQEAIQGVQRLAQTR